MLAGAPPGREVWGGVGASTEMDYIGIQLFSAKQKVAGVGGFGMWNIRGFRDRDSVTDSLYRDSVIFRQKDARGGAAGT